MYYTQLLSKRTDSSAQKKNQRNQILIVKRKTAYRWFFHEQDRQEIATRSTTGLSVTREVSLYACRGMRESATQQFRAIGAAHSPDRRPDKTWHWCIPLTSRRSFERETTKRGFCCWTFRASLLDSHHRANQRTRFYRAFNIEKSQSDNPLIEHCLVARSLSPRLLKNRFAM